VCFRDHFLRVRLEIVGVSRMCRNKPAKVTAREIHSSKNQVPALPNIVTKSANSNYEMVLLNTEKVNMIFRKKKGKERDSHINLTINRQNHLMENFDFQISL